MDKTTESSSAVIIERGVYTMGRTQTDKDGNVVVRTESAWTTKPGGATVVVYPISSEDREQLKPADIFSALDCCSIAEAALAALGLKLNLPDLADIWKKAGEDGFDLCSFCASGAEQCENCYIRLKNLEAM